MHPIGYICEWIGGDLQGWLLCDGRSLSQREYPELFQVIGYKYGSNGDLFRLPAFNETQKHTIPGSKIIIKAKDNE